MRILNGGEGVGDAKEGGGGVINVFIRPSVGQAGLSIALLAVGLWERGYTCACTQGLLDWMKIRNPVTLIASL